MFIVSNAVLEGLNLVAAKGDVRYYLNGVYFRAKDGVLYAAATDGHICLHGVVASWVSEGKAKPVDFEYIIPRETIELHLKVMKAHKNVLSVPVGVEHKLLDIGFKPIDGKFPDFWRMTPDLGAKEKPTATVGAISEVFDPELLICLGKAMLLCRDGHHKKAVLYPQNLVVSSTPTGGGKIGVATTSNKELCLIGLIMPFRNTGNQEEMVAANQESYKELKSVWGE